MTCSNVPNNMRTTILSYLVCNGDYSTGTVGFVPLGSTTGDSVRIIAHLHTKPFAACVILPLASAKSQLHLEKALPPRRALDETY